MIANDSAVIQELVVCHPKDLRDAAKKHGLSLPMASLMRDHWVRRITSRCVQCNIIVQGDICPRCQTVKNSAMEFLQKVDPNDVVLKRYCTNCAAPFHYTAKDVLTSFRRNRVFKPSYVCDRCKPKNPKKKPKMAQKQIEKNTSSVQVGSQELVQTPRAVLIKKKRDEALTYRPFEALKGENMKK